MLDHGGSSVLLEGGKDLRPSMLEVRLPGKPRRHGRAMSPMAPLQQFFQQTAWPMFGGGNWAKCGVSNSLAGAQRTWGATCAGMTGC
jgi:hypothetical protein